MSTSPEITNTIIETETQSFNSVGMIDGSGVVVCIESENQYSNTGFPLLKAGAFVPDAAHRNRFTVVDSIRSGSPQSPATLYRASDRQSGELVVLKIFTENDETTSARVDREFFLHEHLGDEPGIVPFVSKGELAYRGSTYRYLAMKYMDEGTLRVVEQGNVAALGQLYANLGASALGLRALNERGFVHRDAKPENIMIANGPEGRVACVGDLGIVAEAHDVRPGSAFRKLSGSVEIGIRPKPQADQAYGSVPIIAPEYLLEGKLSAESDHYAFYATAYIAATGRWPLQPTNKKPGEVTLNDQIASFHEGIEPVRPHLINSAISGKVSEIIMRGLVDDPATRAVPEDLTTHREVVALAA